MIVKNDNAGFFMGLGISVEYRVWSVEKIPLHSTLKNYFKIVNFLTCTNVPEVMR